ncbi:hypothetical protein PFICI_06655 [Pestalotiopsis fici W106-1]|uniref:Heterokaryon incompatibility domain-containing protein n=1 Tax=Pestalotiopsis fici (strain W106-1 / CGMCC3.15140) TaxID=1229662 RepID=W3X6B1_PESFW|nr:uncharacterized protein PFICI_06655 [Pestalotiopsis fici W106-1]ETS81653.1 hypothetical protein PFICI_06655 [Pestalotiopsis fici W106-1]
MRRIGWDLLPNTFRDAIEVTRELKVQFLWIDSLCIIQDDEDDWKEESSKMASVYRNSYLTICATAGESDDAGLWHRLPTGTSTKVIIQHTAKQYEVYFRKVGVTRFLHTDSESGIHLREIGLFSPLITRGWTLQERLLSPRLLHYGHGDSLYMAGTKRFSNVVRNMQTSSYHDEVENCWRLLVEHYSTLRLTLSKDVLPAVSALANICSAARPGDRYLVGLWERSIIDDMCWRKIDVLTNRPDTWRAPSWSWASITGQIGYFSASIVNKAYSRLIRASTQLAGSDPMGEVLSASVVLKGPVREAIITDVYPRHFQVVTRLASVDCYADSWTDFRKGLIEFGAAIFCLRLRSHFASDLIMILVEVDGKPNVYQRVGIVGVKTDEADQYWFGDDIQDREIEIV